MREVIAFCSGPSPRGLEQRGQGLGEKQKRVRGGPEARVISWARLPVTSTTCFHSSGAERAGMDIVCTMLTMVVQDLQELRRKGIRELLDCPSKQEETHVKAKAFCPGIKVCLSLIATVLRG